MLTMWVTQSPINRTVVKAVSDGLSRHGEKFVIRFSSEYDGNPVPSISYGVLRGTGRIYRDCERVGIPWWNVDRGFFKPEHPHGYYRIGYRHLQPTFLHEAREDRSRWRSLQIQVRPWKKDLKGVTLLCPPEGICEFYAVEQAAWIRRVLLSIPKSLDQHTEVRFRSSGVTLQEALDKACCVITHSSNVALEAVLNGVPSFADTGFVRSWNNMTIQDAGRSQDHLDREELFAQAANRQFLLDEFRSGLAWEHVSRSLLVEAT